MITRVRASLVACCLVLTACGGGDDDAAATTTAPASEPATTPAPTPPPTPAPTTTPPLVVDGATVVVANGNIVGGSAGRMTDTIAREGFTTASPVNGATKVEESVVYYTTADGAQAVAESLATVMGGVEVVPMPDPIPTEDGTLVGGDVLLLLGNNQADKTLDELGGAPTGALPAGDGAVDGSSVGSTIVVANANTTAGSAGRMTALLQAAGFTTAEPVNATRQLTASIVYHTDADGAAADAETVARALGGVSVEPMPTPIPVEGGAFDGQILVLLGAALSEGNLTAG